ncbi:MAG: orotidine-5'-phosphate decarboxylase, partial [Bacilli bacterium]
GAAMMAGAREGLYAGTPAGQTVPKLIAVTQLTSTSQTVLNEEMLIKEDMQNAVLHLAKLTQKSGLDGVVCSPLESAAITEVCGASFLKVTPGIRMLSDAANDQVRIATPISARSNGSTHIVVGRSITAAQDPAAAYAAVKKNWYEGK